MTIQQAVKELLIEAGFTECNSNWGWCYLYHVISNPKIKPDQCIRLDDKVITVTIDQSKIEVMFYHMDTANMDTAKSLKLEYCDPKLFNTLDKFFKEHGGNSISCLTELFNRIVIDDYPTSR